MDRLNEFLQYNDCKTTVAKSACYETTRLFLIATTKELDKTTAQVDNLNTVIDKLIENINTIIDTISVDSKKK